MTGQATVVGDQQAHITDRVLQVAQAIASQIATQVGNVVGTALRVHWLAGEAPRRRTVVARPLAVVDRTVNRVVQHAREQTEALLRDQRTRSWNVVCTGVANDRKRRRLCGN